VSKLRSLDPQEFSFRLDEFRNVKAIVAEHDIASQKEYPPEWFLAVSFLQRYENPFGTSDLQAAHFRIWLIDELWKSRAQWLETFGTPTKVGTMPDGDYKNPDLKSQFSDDIDSIQEECTMVLGDGYNIDFIEATKDGEAFQTAIEQLAMEAVVSILWSFQGTLEGSVSGSRATSEVHADKETQAVELVRQTLEWQINPQLICDLVRKNFPGVEEFPTFEIDRAEGMTAEKAETAVKRLEAIEKAIKMKVDVTVDHVREIIASPVPEPDQGLISAPAAPPNPFTSPPPPVPGEPAIVDENQGPTFAEGEVRDLSTVARKILIQDLAQIAKAEANARPRFKDAIDTYVKETVSDVKKKRQKGSTP